MPCFYLHNLCDSAGRFLTSFLEDPTLIWTVDDAFFDCFYSVWLVSRNIQGFLQGYMCIKRVLNNAIPRRKLIRSFQGQFPVLNALLEWFIPFCDCQVAAINWAPFSLPYNMIFSSKQKLFAIEVITADFHGAPLILYIVQELHKIGPEAIFARTAA